MNHWNLPRGIGGGARRRVCFSGPAMRIRAAKAVIFSLLTTTSLAAAVPGTPEPPHPGAPPILWAEIGNDDLTLEGAEGQSIDDHRSNEITVGLVVADVALVIDHA